MSAREPQPVRQIGLPGETDSRLDAIRQLVLPAEQLPAGNGAPSCSRRKRTVHYPAGNGDPRKNASLGTEAAGAELRTPPHILCVKREPHRLPVPPLPSS